MRLLLSQNPETLIGLSEADISILREPTYSMSSWLFQLKAAYYLNPPNLIFLKFSIALIHETDWTIYLS